MQLLSDKLTVSLASSSVTSTTTSTTLCTSFPAVLVAPCCFSQVRLGTVREGGPLYTVLNPLTRTPPIKLETSRPYLDRRMENLISADGYPVGRMGSFSFPLPMKPFWPMT